MSSEHHLWNSSQDLRVSYQQEYIAFKSVFLIYELSWWIYSLMTTKYPEYFYYFTNFTELWIVLHFSMSLIFAVEEYHKKDDTSPRKDVLKWYHKFSWVVHTIMMMSTFVTIIIFWTMIAPERPRGDNLRPLNLHNHGIVTVMACIDLFVSDIPVRIVHFVYGMGYGFIYGLYILNLHFMGETSRIYSFTDWKDNPTYSAIVCTLIMTIAPIVTQMMSFSIYKLREWVRQKMLLPKIEVVDCTNDLPKFKNN